MENLERMSQLILSLPNKKADPENDENAIEFRWSDAQEEDEKDIVKVNFIEKFQKLVDEENLF